MLSVIVRARADAFIRAWVENPLVPVAVEDLYALGVVLRKNGANAEVELQPVDVGFSTVSSVVAISHPVHDIDRDISLWVRAEYGNYAQAYRRFVQRFYEVTAIQDQMVRYNVDHLLNRKRSNLSGLWLRVEAASATVNQAWGRTFERNASDPQLFANQTRTRRTACFGIAAKMAGLTPPASDTDEVQIQAVIHYFRGVLPGDEPDPADGVRSYFNRIYGRHPGVTVAVVEEA